VLGRVHPWTRTTVGATVLAGGIVLETALLIPFEKQLALDNGLTMAIFAVVGIALWRIQRQQPAGEGVFEVPRWVPPAAAALAVGLIVAEAVS